MKKSTLIHVFAVALTLLFASGLHAQSTENQTTTQDVKQETQELLNTLKSYSYEQREKAVAAADQAMTRLDTRIEALEDRVDTNWDQMTQNARQEARSNLKGLRQQRNELAQWYGGFENSSAEAWEEMKKGFSGAYRNLSNSWDKALREYDRKQKQSQN